VASRALAALVSSRLRAVAARRIARGVDQGAPGGERRISDNGHGSGLSRSIRVRPADYFPDQVAVLDADRISREYNRSYKDCDCAQTYPGGPSAGTCCLQAAHPLPPMTGPLADAQVIKVPITSLFQEIQTTICRARRLGTASRCGPRVGLRGTGPERDPRRERLGGSVGSSPRTG